MNDAQRQGPVRDAFGVRGYFVPRLSAPAASKLRQLRVDVCECERVGLEKDRLARPGCAAVDLQPQRAEKARFAEVVPGQRLVIAAVPACADHQQRGPLPRVQLAGANECESHACTCFQVTNSRGCRASSTLRI